MKSLTHDSSHSTSEGTPYEAQPLRSRSFLGPRWVRCCAAALLLVAGLQAQTPLRIPVDADGALLPPSGVELRQALKLERFAGISDPYYDPGPGGPRTGVVASEASMAWPFGIAVGPDDSVYVSDLPQLSEVRRINASTGLIEAVLGLSVGYYTSLAVDAAGVVFAIDVGSGAIDRSDPSTETSERLPTAEGQLSEPMGLGLDATGNVFVADAGRHRILKIAPSTGTVETVAGTGVQGDGGDGGPATSPHYSRTDPDWVANQKSGALPI